MTGTVLTRPVPVLIVTSSFPPLGCVLKVLKFQAHQFSAMKWASKEAHLGGFEVNECGIFGRMGLYRVGRPFFNHFRNTS